MSSESVLLALLVDFVKYTLSKLYSRCTQTVIFNTF